MSLRNKLAWMLGGSVPHSKDELKALLELAGKRSQLLSESELEMLRNVLSMTEKTTKDVRIPRGEVVWLYADSTYAEILAEVTRNRHSRFPVIDANNEKVIGILHVKRLIGFQAEPDEQILANGSRAKLLQKAHTVPTGKTLDAMLREFRHYLVHMMVVADDGGNIDGMITIEDVIEHIVGEIRDEFDTETPAAAIRPHGSAVNCWEIDGDIQLDEFNEHFKLNLDRSRADTISGWLANTLGRLPVTGDEISEGPLSLKVAQSDQRKVVTVIATRHDGSYESEG